MDSNYILLLFSILISNIFLLLHKKKEEVKFNISKSIKGKECPITKSKHKKSQLTSMKINTYLLNLLIPFILVLFFSSVFETCEGIIDIYIPPITPGGSSSVNITNNLGQNIDLTLHCKSKDDDLGTHLLHNKGSYGFRFTRNIWKTTLFFCGFRWGNEFHWFDIYDAKKFDCTKPCLWSIIAKGPCLLNYDTNQYDYCYERNKDKSHSNANKIRNKLD